MITRLRFIVDIDVESINIDSEEEVIKEFSNETYVSFSNTTRTKVLRIAMNKGESIKIII